MAGKAIRARGVVQGVGFRPTIWHLARQHDLTGSIWNDNEGVMIHAFGIPANLAQFIDQIPRQLPPLAKLTSLEVTDLHTAAPADFRIVDSHTNAPAQTTIAADAATCPACLSDIFDPDNRRYHYPFTNCTHCGPRLSIVQRVPYDRCHTSMAVFPMCADCQHEYLNPADRRFHAQANGCPVCGPQVWLEDEHGRLPEQRDPIQQTAELLKLGHIVAIKGLGGVHLACDASNEIAVNRLRQRKQRYAKPLALMAKDIHSIRRYAHINTLEQQALLDKAAPIVLLQAAGEKLADSLAPGDDKLGFMLPYTPLHSLLMQALDKPIVLTSGNISDEPQCISNHSARVQLTGIADFWLLHDRDIVNRLDDSVVRVMNGQLHVLRRARGYTPDILTLPSGFDNAGSILAMGAELKNSFCLLKHGQAIVSQHIGDLESAAVQADYRHAIELYQHLFDFQPDRIAIDIHPGYLSSQYGQALAAEIGAEIVPVHHHHAHLAACLAEHAVPLDSRPVLAAIFDGLGMGEHRELWGGEFLLGDYRGYQRLGHFQPIALLGGTQAMREPWRNTYAQLRHYFDWADLLTEFADLAIMQCLADKPLSTLDTMQTRQLNSPLCSSAGRWFDAFAAALDLHTERVYYEGQGAIALETLATPAFALESAYLQAYCIESANPAVLNWRGLWLAVLTDLKNQVDKTRIAARIHHSLIDASVAMLSLLAQQTGAQTIVLSGGVFQNRLLLEGLTQKLENLGITVLSPRQYPMNDGGLALGQAVIAACK